MNDSVEEFDRTMALQIAAPAGRAIAVGSIEEFEGLGKALRLEGIPPSEYPMSYLTDILALQKGEAYLQLPDGSQWVNAEHLVKERSHFGEGNRFLQRLFWIHTEHNLLRHHEEPDSDGYFDVTLSNYYVDRATLDLRHVFCRTCRRMVDLQADAIEAEATLAPWENLEGIAWWCVPAEGDEETR